MTTIVHHRRMLIPFFLFLFAAIDGSVVPIANQLEQVENLSSKKYTTRQFQEIKKALSRTDEKIRVMSYNILFNLFEDKKASEHCWDNRCSRVVELIEEISPDILGVQEMYQKQLSDLLSKLGDTYQFVSRDPNIGECNGIFYRKERFEELNKKVWDTHYQTTIFIADNLTELTLKDQETGKVFTILNTHFSFTEPDVREAQAELAGQIASSLSMPVLLTGDFNTFPARPDLKKCPFYDGDHIHRILSAYSLKDAKELSLLGHIGPISTFTNVGEDPEPFLGTGMPGIFLDHLYVSKGVTVLLHAVQPAKIDGHFPSDHMPLFADILIDE